MQNTAFLVLSSNITLKSTHFVELVELYRELTISSYFIGILDPDHCDNM